MIQIRQNQIEAMDKMMLDKEVTELSARLAEEHPVAVGRACPEPEQRENFVRTGYQEAFECGVRGKENVYLFVEARLLLGPRFHEDRCQLPELVQLLRDGKVSEATKADAISEKLAMREVFG